MERNTIFWIEKTILWNDCITEINLQIQSNAFQTTNGIFHITRAKKTQFVGKHERSQIAKAILIKKKMELEELTLLTSDKYCKAPVTKIVWYWHKKRNIDQWNKIESAVINPCFYGQLTFDKRFKDIQWRQDKLILKWCWEN